MQSEPPIIANMVIGEPCDRVLVARLLGPAVVERVLLVVLKVVTDSPVLPFSRRTVLQYGSEGTLRNLADSACIIFP